MPTIFNTSYLLSLLEDAELDMVGRVDYLFHRFALDITSGTSTYTLPAYFRKAIRVTWRGKKLDPLRWHEMAQYTPATFIGGSLPYEHSSGTPRYYAFHPTNYRDIRFFPTPNEDITYDLANDDLSGPNIADRVIVSCWRSPDVTNSFWQMPSYVQRRTAKAYAGMRAFAKEGKGQSLAASQYYETKYEFLVELFRKINAGVFVSKKPRLKGEYIFDTRKPGRPLLPPNFPANSW